MKKHFAIVAAAAALALASVPALAQNIATVNGKPIPKSRLDAIVHEMQTQASQDGSAVPPGLEKQITQQLKVREVFFQEAERQGVQKTPEFKTQLDIMSQNVMINVLFEQYLKQNPVTDAEAQAFYQDLVKQNDQRNKELATSTKEYKARHILLESADKAADVIAQLKKGANFADLAKKLSKDPNSAVNGGELGWANPKIYAPEFAQALTKLNKGQISETPVKTQFGYHVIEVEDTRDVKPPPPQELPPFKDLKSRIMQQLGKQKVAVYQKKLVDAAKIDPPLNAGQ